MRSVHQAEREGTATGPPPRSPDAPPDPPQVASNSGGGGNGGEAERKARDDAISHAGGGFGAAIIQQNLAAREGRPVPPEQRVDPTATPPAMNMPFERSKLSEQLPHAAKRLGERFAEAGAFLMKGPSQGGGGRRPDGAAVEVAGDARAIARETETKGMPPLGQADASHKKLAERFKRREGI